MPLTSILPLDKFLAQTFDDHFVCPDPDACSTKALEQVGSVVLARGIHATVHAMKADAPITRAAAQKYIVDHFDDLVDQYATPNDLFAAYPETQPVRDALIGEAIAVYQRPAVIGILAAGIVLTYLAYLDQASGSAG